LISATLIAQSPSPAVPQALTTLQNSLLALTGKTIINDVTLLGTAEWIAGSDDETGTVVFKSANGANRLDAALSNGIRSEVRLITSAGVSGKWIGQDGVSHPIADHNLMTDSGQFPAFTLTNLLSSSNSVFTYVGLEPRNLATVIHISAFQQVPNTSNGPSGLMQHLSQVEIYLDPSTSLPVSYLFNSHPDDNALLDLPTEIRYSNYQSVNGVQIPFHVQKYLNGTLLLDIQFQSASLNTGITASQISAQ
jgi:hypothetical protein